MADDDNIAQLLMIDDDRELGAMVTDFLAIDQLAVTVRNTGEEGIEAFKTGGFDLVILDIMMPGISGLEVLKKIRQNSNVPVVMLTARGDDVDRIIGLEFGADDYLPKPFHLSELNARLKAIFRRRNQGGQDTLSFNELELNVNTFEVKVNDELLECGPHLIQSEKYNLKNNLGKLPLRLILKKNKHDHLVGSQKLGFNVNTIKLWKNYGKDICKEFLTDARIVKEGWINNDWIKKYIDKSNLDIKFVNKFLGILSLEIWYRLFITKEISSELKLN